MDDSQNVFEPGALSRRGFLKGSAVAAVSAGALSSLVACAPSSPAPKEGLAGTAGATSVDEGIWIAAACWDNCGGRCVNRVLVRDGEVVRQGSETSHEDSFEWLQQRGCPRGRARAQQVFGEDRVKFPMKRKSWQPGGPALVKFGETGLPATKNALADTMPEPLMWQCIREGRYNSTGAAYGVNFNAEDIKETEFKWLNIEGRNTLQTAVGLSDAREAIQKLDFVTDLAYTFDTSAAYADIVLPCATEWERVGGFAGHQRSRETVVVYSRVTEPLWEAKTEFEIGRMLAARLGMDPDELWPITEEQAFFNQIVGCTYVDAAGEEKPLVTITADDIAKWGVDAEPQEGDIALDDFLSAGCYTVKRAEGDGYSYIGYKDFVDDPEANPRESASGKLEIYCQYKGDMLNSMGYSPAGTFKPYPTYVASPEGREGMFADRQIGGAASEYPLIVYNPHYLRRAHGVMDNVPWLREAWSAPVFVSAADAAARGVADGDTVRVYSAHGSVLRTASVVEMLMPGCVGLPHGAWADFSKDDGIDVAGMDNVLCGSVTSGMGTSGYNNYNCNFEKYEGEALVADCELPCRTVAMA